MVAEFASLVQMLIDCLVNVSCERSSNNQWKNYHMKKSVAVSRNTNLLMGIFTSQEDLSDHNPVIVFMEHSDYVHQDDELEKRNHTAHPIESNQRRGWWSLMNKICPEHSLKWPMARTLEIACSNHKTNPQQ